MPAYVGTIADIVVVLILIFSFLGGLKGGAIKEFFGLLSFLISIPLAGLFVSHLVSWVSFVGDSTWRSFLAFILTMGIFIIILYLILWIPRHFLEKIWTGGFFWSFMGGVLGLLNSALGLVFLVCLFSVYPVFSWLDSLFVSSAVLNGLVNTFGAFIMALLKSTNLAGVAASISSFVAL